MIHERRVQHRDSRDKSFYLRLLLPIDETESPSARTSKGFLHSGTRFAPALQKVPVVLGLLPASFDGSSFGSVEAAHRVPSVEI